MHEIGEGVGGQLKKGGGGVQLGERYDSLWVDSSTGPLTPYWPSLPFKTAEFKVMRKLGGLGGAE